MGIASLYKKLEEYVNTPTIYDIEPYHEVVGQINEYYDEIKFKDDKYLYDLHLQIQKNVSENNREIDLVIQAFALIKSLAEKFLSLEAYDVQLIAGLILYEGRIVEMKTGEGKTLAALFPTYLRAIEGKGMHVHSFNDYLSVRDHDLFKPIFDFLEIPLAFIKEGMPVSQKNEALDANICYGSAKQFIYTYLQQSISDVTFEKMQEKFQYAIIDEADAILLDEATNPFVIAGNRNDFQIEFSKIAKAVKLLVKAGLYEFSDFKRNVYLNDEGIEFMSKMLNIENLYEEENTRVLSAINLSLHAHVLLERDIHYIIKNGEIQLVDEFTGRVVEDRKWRNGLQSAVEAKEGVEVKSEGSILNSISIPNFYKQYKLISAMTATAKESSVEFKDTYGLGLVVVPPNLPSIRIDQVNRVFKNKELKYKAIIEKITDEHQKGRPILIGTQHVSESELIYEKLKLRSLKCEILNAKNDELEAEIISKAGMLHSIVISTNMAGRGTDIKLGGEQRKRTKEIENLGGLLVIGTNMHDSGRIDRQLRGRAGRQGEPGESQFYVSMEDDLFKVNKLKEVLAKKYKENIADEIVDDKVHMYLNHAQEVAEDQDNLLRETINKYAEMSFYQSQLIAQRRSEIIEEDLPKPLMDVLISNIDAKWSETISSLFEVKDSIRFISLGGQNPLRAYRMIGDNLYNELRYHLDQDMLKLSEAFNNDKDSFALMNKIRRPSSTWTYTVSDKGFSSGLISLIKESGNIGFQVDIMGLTVLFGKAMYEKMRRIFRSTKRS